MGMTGLKRATRAVTRTILRQPCRDGHSRFQHIVNRRDGARVQVCDRCGQPVGRPLPAERREVRRVA